MTKWTTKNILRQSGRSTVVTALALAHASASVVIARHNPQKGAEAVAAITNAVARAQVRSGKLDLANLASIAGFATQWFATISWRQRGEA